MTTHPIFQTYPLAEEMVETSMGKQPTPYHVYNGHAILIGGTANFDKVSTLLQGEQITPVQTIDGKALMALWIVDESAASHGAHTEFQASFYVTHQPIRPIEDSPFAILKFLLSEPRSRQMCHGLWNNTPEVVAYNREILGLMPRLANSEIVHKSDRVTFSFRNATTDALVVDGSVRRMKRPPLNAVMSLFRTFGFIEALKAASIKTVETKVVNPVNDILAKNRDALTASASDSIVAQLFDPLHDQINIADSVYGSLDFAPVFVEHMAGFKMVYLEPDQLTHSFYGQHRANAWTRQ